MAASAYAAVVSLMHVIDNLQHSVHRGLHFDGNQIEILREKVSFLLDFLENYSQRFSTDKEDLARQMADVANEAEDVIDFHVVDQLCQRSADTSLSYTGLSSFCNDIDKVIKKIDSIKKELMMIKEERSGQEKQARVSPPSVSSNPLSSGKNVMGGFDKHLDRVVDQLMSNETCLQIVSIVGMGGIGKTTLAKNVFDNQHIKEHFDKCVWFTISQEYSVQEIILGCLHGKGKVSKSSENLPELREQLYKSLFGKRYLIVMDDMWSIEAWEDLKSCFPKNGNGSRIMLTTRLTNVAVSLGSIPYFMDFLDREESWNLFCETVFGKEACPLELEKNGKEIVESCGGLPLAIVVIGGLLANSNKTLEYWEFVAHNVNSLANSERDEQCLNILFLSYKHLPIHLKPCFLYLGVFREDEEILGNRLIMLWIAEGFISSIDGKNLEDVALEYLKDLADRNLILSNRSKYNGSYSIHDLVRDLCLRESHREHFYCASKAQRRHTMIGEDICILCGNDRQVREKIYLPQVIVGSQATTPVNCFVCDVCKMYPYLNRLRVVRGIDMLDDNGAFEVLQPTKLRCLYFRPFDTDARFVLGSISILWNLQTLILWSEEEVSLPSEIWEMRQLRHLVAEGMAREFGGFFDPEFTKIHNRDGTSLDNLITFSCIINFSCSNEVVERIPNLKVLGLRYTETERSSYSLQNLAHLQKLESLSLCCPYVLGNRVSFSLDEMTVGFIGIFPNSLKNLSLTDCKIPCEYMTIIGSLPNLEVLELIGNVFTGPKWNPIEGEFLRLNSLSLEWNDFRCWRAEKSHFPILQSLRLWEIRFLKEIPSGIGEIETLCSIHLDLCSESVVDSAKQMVEEQRSVGNESLQVFIDAGAYYSTWRNGILAEHPFRY